LGRYKERIAIIGKSMSFDLEQNSDLSDVLLGETETKDCQLVEPDPLDEDDEGE
jgi:hypothetical protein